MIQSTIELLYDARNGEKRAIIQMEIKNWTVSLSGITYSVDDYALYNDSKQFISTKSIFYSWEQINSLDSYLESLNGIAYAGLSKKDNEYLKVKHALLIETQTNPVYGSTAGVWVLTTNDEI